MKALPYILGIYAAGIVTTMLWSLGASFNTRSPIDDRDGAKVLRTAIFWPFFLVVSWTK